MGEAGRVERRHRIKNHQHHTRNQPMPKIWTSYIFKPKPTDKMSYYCVNPDKPIDLGTVASRLAELYGMNVWIYESLFGSFDVYLDKPVEKQIIEEITLKVLGTVPNGGTV